MMAQIIDGKQCAAEIRSSVASRVMALGAKGVTPGLAAVLIGDDPASRTYVRAKEKACAEVGIYSEIIRKEESCTQSELLSLVDELNSNPKIDGILVQSPLPEGLDEMAVTLRIDPAKDVDGFHPFNVGALSLGLTAPRPCTPSGIIELLKFAGVETSGKEVVVVGRSNIVGKPIAALLSQKTEMGNATVTLCHSRTREIEAVCRRADILVAAIGRAEFITAEFLKPGVVVIDVGVNRVDDSSRKRGYRLTGDVDFASAEKVASFITPVPGGVGPMTIAMLLSNTVAIAERRAAK
ncbi:bifunctional methylenetetrahydrofolate dehydrogenase/methenyltetrahydrofolate cyclohydrolase FolD [bacterium AH-315-J21]|nr:bifunctional methylenetetrahydrofolate dehydrogenase/methenyltetrahydrofolate cyclohydrolase FolD [bacterium AH-315-J21]